MEPRFIFSGGSYPGTTAVLSVYPDVDTVVAVVTNTWGKSGSNWTLPLLSEIGAALVDQ